MVVEMPGVRQCVSQDKITTTENLSNVQTEARSIRTSDCRPMSQVYRYQRRKQKPSSPGSSPRSSHNPIERLPEVRQ